VYCYYSLKANMFPMKFIKAAKIDGGIFMDNDESNNQWTAK